MVQVPLHGSGPLAALLKRHQGSREKDKQVGCHATCGTSSQGTLLSSATITATRQAARAANTYLAAY